MRAVVNTAENQNLTGPGGKRPGAGRKPGSVNKVTAEIRSAAQAYGAEALETLAELMRDSDNPGVRVAAAKELLDRGYGRSSQHVELTGKDGKDLIPATPLEAARKAAFLLELAADQPTQH